jgi:rhodanese-related sulfurtransferase
MKIKTNFKVVFTILFASIFLGVVYNSFSSSGIEFIRNPIQVKFVNVGDESEDNNILKGIELAQAVELFDKKSAKFIDARDQWEFAENHIKGAINIPEFSFSKSDSTLKNIFQNDLLVVYCDGDDCDISKRLTKELIDLGYKNAYVFLGGFKDWKEANLPIEKGKVK